MVSTHCVSDVITCTECCPCMQEGAGPEWDHIDQPTLDEVEKSWTLSRCREVEFDISSGSFLVSVSLLNTYSVTPLETV